MVVAPVVNLNYVIRQVEYFNAAEKDHLPSINGLLRMLYSIYMLLLYSKPIPSSSKEARVFSSL